MGLSICASTGLHADWLQLSALEGGLQALNHQLSCRGCVITQFSWDVFDEKFGEQDTLIDIL